MSLRDELSKTTYDVVQRRQKERTEYLKKICKEAAETGEYFIDVKKYIFDDNTELTNFDVEEFAMLYDLQYTRFTNTGTTVKYIGRLSW